MGSAPPHLPRQSRKRHWASQRRLTASFSLRASDRAPTIGPHILIGAKMITCRKNCFEQTPSLRPKLKRGVEFKGVAVMTETAMTAESAKTVKTATVASFCRILKDKQQEGTIGAKMITCRKNCFEQLIFELHRITVHPFLFARINFRL